LKQRISSVEPEFNKLTNIRDQFQQEILSTRDTQAKAIADSFRSYVLGLGDTFESDFLRYQPDLKLFEFLSKGKRDAFNAELQKAFEQYITDKLGGLEPHSRARVECRLRTTLQECGELWCVLQPGDRSHY
jgi:hypothetical protein